MKKRLLIIILLSIFFIPSVVKAENLTPEVDSTQKIYDFAELLSEEEEQKLYSLVSDYISKYNMDMVLLTISENPYGISDRYTELYAQDFYDYNNFGIGDTYDGIIIIIDMANRYPFIVTTGEAILTYDDERINNMHDDAYDYLANGEYYKAFEAYVESADSYASSGVPESNQYYCIDSDGEYYKCKSAPKKVNWLVTILASVFGSFIPVFVHLRKYRGIRLATNANSYLKSTIMTTENDTFLTTFTTRTRRSSDSGGSGHSGGGSSISHGSSGRSHGGGGGRHF